MVAKDTSYGSETYRPYLDIEKIINIQSAGSVNRGHDPHLEAGLFGTTDILEKKINTDSFIHPFFSSISEY